MKAGEPMLPGERTLRNLLRPIEGALAHPDTREVVVNRPGEYGVEQSGGWTWHEAPELTFDRLDTIGIYAASLTGQTISQYRPSCSSRLPDGQRITIARPPQTAPGTISLTIRKRASSFIPTLEWLSERGYFSCLDPSVDWVEEFRGAVQRRETIGLIGETGSSKTTFAEALIREIPLHERIITAESVPEWTSLPHRNWVPLLYAQEGERGRKAEQVLQDALRMRPDRLLYGELRTGEAWALLRALQGGHDGTITTWHADDDQDPFDAVALMARQHSAAQGMEHADIRALFSKRFHLVAWCEKVPGDPVPYRVSAVRRIQSKKEARRGRALEAA